jgi:hypothetical protein
VGSRPLVGALGSGKNAARNLQARLVLAAGTPRLSGSRLRSTWLVSHLRQGTRLPELVDAAGLRGLTVLSDLLPHVPQLSPAQSLLMLTGRCT